MKLTPISYFDGWCCKREDQAGWLSLDYPSGSKWRQYLRMAGEAPGVPMIVGCTSYSAMQIYVGAAAKLNGVKAHIYVPDRAVQTSATSYAFETGACIHLVPGPAWGSVLRKRARDKAKELGQVVRWMPDLALKDTMFQCGNLPDTVKRVIVPTGSGLTASGVLAGLALRRKRPIVVAVAVSSMAKGSLIMQKAEELVYGVHGGFFNYHLPSLILKQVKAKYGAAVGAALPDGTPLDPYYAAKAMPFIQPGDCLWVPGLRPVSSMPERLRGQFADWKGFAEPLITARTQELLS